LGDEATTTRKQREGAEKGAKKKQQQFGAVGCPTTGRGQHGGFDALRKTRRRGRAED